jgi:Flp pilus assembly protein TadB
VVVVAIVVAVLVVAVLAVAVIVVAVLVVAVLVVTTATTRTATQHKHAYKTRITATPSYTAQTRIRNAENRDRNTAQTRIT